MTTINSNYYNLIGKTSLSYLLGNNSSTNSSSISSILTDSSSSTDDSDDLFQLLKSNSGFRDYSLLTDSTGKAYIPTIKDMNAAASPDAKLTLAKGVSGAVLMQADASSKCGNASRIEDIANQAESVLQAVSDAVTSLTQNAGDSSEAIASALASSQKTIFETLNNLNAALTEIKNLLSKAASDVQTTVTETLTAIDKQASELARKSEVSWTSITGNKDYTVSGYSAATDSNNTTTYSGTNSLLDILA